MNNELSNIYEVTTVSVDTTSALAHYKSSQMLIGCTTQTVKTEEDAIYSGLFD